MRVLPVALAAVLAFGLVACGDDDDDNGATPAATTTTSGATATATSGSGGTPAPGQTATTTTPAPAATLAPTFACTNAIDFFAARALRGEDVTVQGEVMGTTIRGDSVVLFVGAPEGAELRLEVVISSEGRSTFAAPPETAFANREVCVKGTVELVDNITTIQASSPDELSVVE